MPVKILLLENNPHHSNTIESSVLAMYQGLEIELITNEEGFMDRISAMTLDGVCPWAFVISGVLLPWSEKIGSRQGADFRGAGIRCWKNFRLCLSHNIPWIYYTILDDRTMCFDENSDELTFYIQKAGSIQPLLGLIGDVLACHTPEAMRRLKAELRVPLEDYVRELP